MTVTKLHVGSVVQVKSEPEILALLDDKGCFEGLPFTEEMRKFCGTICTIRAVVNRFHIEGIGIRGIKDTVILEEARCDGRAHGMCDRACYLFFKSAWLNALPQALETGRSEANQKELLSIPSFWKDGDQSCQGNSTVLVKATSNLSRLDMRQYIQDVKTGTWRVRDVLFILLFLFNRRWDLTESVWDVSLGKRTAWDICKMALIVLGQNIRWCFKRILYSAKGDKKSEAVHKSSNSFAEPLNLQSGEWVEVKSRKEIIKTLGDRQRCRGLGFSSSMVKHCGERFQVAGRITNLVDEKTGKRIKNIKDTVVLEDCLCMGISFRGCPRGCYWFWKEDWLKRVDHKLNRK